MCNRYHPARGDADFAAWKVEPPTNFPPGPLKIGPYAIAPFIRPRQGALEVVLGQWGMIRPGARERRAMKGKVPMLTNNARSETMATLPTYRGAWAAGQRCIIPAVSFDEPNWETGKNRWFEFRPRRSPLWSLAGLWSEWTDPETGEVVPNYTMVTVNADHHSLLNRMHRPDKTRPEDKQDKRGIVPLQGDLVDAWLYGTPEEAFSALQLPAAEDYDAGPIAAASPAPATAEPGELF